MTSSDTSPVDPPIPVPDVAGADASAGGLPRRVDLTLRQRLIVDSSAAADIALRTAIASLLAATMLPTLVGGLRRSQSRAEREQLRFYAELAAAKSTELSFPAPTTVPRVSSRPANPIAEWIAKGNVHNIRFNSGFEAVNPALRDQCRGFTRNNRLAPPEQAEMLWKHWDRCAFHWFPGNHILHVSQPDYLRRMTRFMRDFMFA